MARGRRLEWWSILGHLTIIAAMGLTMVTDVEMNKADCQTGAASMLGILGITWGCGGPTRSQPERSRCPGCVTA